MNGVLYGVGVGPGDPELITVKALRVIRESEVVILPVNKKEECYAYRIVEQIYPEIAQKELRPMHFPMTKDQAILEKAHEEIYQVIKALLLEGKKIAFLTIGDPCIYSTYSYIHSRVLEVGGRAELISGVPSFCAVAGALGISLGDNREEIHIIPASYEIQETMHLKGTRVYMKSGRKLAELKRLLQQQENCKDLQVYAVTNCGHPDEKRTYGLENLDENSGYLTIVVVKARE